MDCELFQQIGIVSYFSNSVPCDTSVYLLLHIIFVPLYTEFSLPFSSIHNTLCSTNSMNVDFEPYLVGIATGAAQQAGFKVYSNQMEIFVV